MKNDIPHTLKIWFIIHFIIDILFAIPLLLFPFWVSHILNIPEADSLAIRLVGAALVAIGISSLLYKDAHIYTYNALLSLKILWSVSALLAIALSFKESVSLAKIIFFLVFLVFCLIWVYFKLRLKKNLQAS